MYVFKVISFIPVVLYNPHLNIIISGLFDVWPTPFNFQISASSWHLKDVLNLMKSKN